jgi:N-acetylglucosamine kinase-like BadF-type ATPase
MFLGVDGGGTKTALVLIDRDGRVLAQHLTSAAHFVATGMDSVRSLLHAAVHTLLAKAAVPASAVEFAFFGLPSYGEDSSVASALDALPSGCLPEGRYRCGNDMVCGWSGSLGGVDGISVVAGTGSICYGERGGMAARCGGWGELFSDEGSAYWIAIRGLNAYSRMSDGRLPRGPLHHLFNARLALDHDLDLCARVYGEAGADRSTLAQFSKLVHEAAVMGDPQAGAIFTQAAEELAGLADTTRQRLGYKAGEAVLVSYSGGVFANAAAILQPRFAAALAARWASYQLREPLLPPDIGAALYAARLHRQPLAASAVERLRQRAQP